MNFSRRLTNKSLSELKSLGINPVCSMDRFIHVELLLGKNVVIDTS